MPWRGPEHPGEFPSLGWLVGEWIEAHCVIPDGDHQDAPYALTDEMWTFLVWHYRLKRDARWENGRWRSAWAYRRSQLVRPQKWGKGPLTAAVTCAEAVGPVLFAGWDADGEPVGREWPTPLIQITAVSEGQTDNVYRALVPMIERGPLAELIPDTGETRINVPGGGRIDPVTSKASSRLGQPITCAIQDETGLWLRSNGGQRLADTQRRGLAGMGGRAIETTNAWSNVENSVAQQTAESTSAGVYRDHRMAPATLSIHNKRERRKIFRVVYGDSWWVDLDRIEDEAAEILPRDPGQVERFFGNRITSEADSYFDRPGWDRCGLPRQVEPGETIAVGFDGSQSNIRGHADETWLRACRLSDGYLFTPRQENGEPMRWRKPEQLELARKWSVPRGEVDAAVAHLMRSYRVARMYADPPYWQSEVEAWAKAYGDDIVIAWQTNRPKQMAEALEQLATDVGAGEVIHDADPEVSEHIGHAQAVPSGKYTIVGKPSLESKIDAAVTSTIAYEARNDVLAAGLLEDTSSSFTAY